MSHPSDPIPSPGRGADPIRHSLVWAAVMIAVALQTAGEPAAQGIQMTLLAGWFASFALSGGLPREAAARECGWLRRALGRLR